MADRQHLKILRKGLTAWNKWRQDHPDIKPDLNDVNLSGANLSGADLTDADLNDVNLSGANLTIVNLTIANLYHANLYHADLSGAYLSGAYLRDANLTGADLSGAYLESANLRDANLRDANISGAYLESANISGAHLYRANFYDADLTGANLTGACIKDWYINSPTNLQNVKCKYIYLKHIYSEEEGKLIYSDRRPHHGNYQEGEFTKLFQKALETVELIFPEGIEWTAFLESFQQLQAEVKSEELSIQGIEKKSGSVFIVRLEVPEKANKAEIQKYIKTEYKAKLKVIEANYQKQLQAKDETIQAKNETMKVILEKGADLLEIAKIVSNFQHNTIINNNPNITSGNTYNTENAAIVHNEAAKQDLKQAATEIQQLLDQLQETNGVSLEVAQQKIAKPLASKAQNYPKLKDRLIQLGKFVGENGAKTAISEEVKEVIKLLLFML